LRRFATDDDARMEEYSEACDASIVLTVKIPLKKDYDWSDKETDSKPKYKSVGWELNVRSKPGPRWVNLKVGSDLSWSFCCMVIGPINCSHLLNCPEANARFETHCNSSGRPEFKTNEMANAPFGKLADLSVG
jgi:hypothetical protein